ncbi:putative protein N(5)-glutamine methyltransferase [Prauserella rugosa]|uniref:putative protein N(5)-glutamine methyltransferase n=1 Tax=Prauserella rugosa TaxID=43354 RepID=UPI0004C33E3E|nr:putative protein N(5)-glutamine methyltransferase [Prauserella rugosa]KMS86815.1 hypothetical protein ACZ91_34715 [Streptomyces regensis]
MVESWVVNGLRAGGCVFAEQEAALLEEATGGATADLERLVARRVAGEPLEYLLGWAEFQGLRIVVEPGVFVPRRRTEFLVERARDVLPPGGVAVDLCCGSGAVAAALRHARPDAVVHAADLDPAAVRCARRNLPARVYEGDLFAALPAALRGTVDVVIANVPYVPSAAIATMPPEARDHEPAAALDGGADGLAVLRRVARAAPDWLAPGGHLLSETSETQSGPAVEELRMAGFDAHAEACDELSATAVIGRRTPDCG